jgi:hypothetical protein
MSMLGWPCINSSVRLGCRPPIPGALGQPREMIRNDNVSHIPIVRAVASPHERCLQGGSSTLERVPGQSVPRSPSNEAVSLSRSPSNEVIPISRVPSNEIIPSSRESVLRSLLQKDCVESMRYLNVLMDHLSVLSTLERGLSALPPPEVPQSGNLQWTSPKYPEGARQELAEIMRGQHEVVMRCCLASGRVDLALEYWLMLPPKPVFYSTLLKLALEYSSPEDLAEIVKVMTLLQDNCDYCKLVFVNVFKSPTYGLWTSLMVDYHVTINSNVDSRLENAR